MKRIKLTLISIATTATLSSCGAFFNQPIVQQSARTGELTSSSKVLKNLPKPKDPIVTGVYSFRDQTGQYKNIEVGSSFSTAVPQGGTTILTKALEDSGWFTVVERENLGNLLNERNIINTTREQYRQAGDLTQTQLPPLLFAGILLEGGIVSYDTNIITGGTGARYFGVGGAQQYREDRITVYLRAVSTTNGKVLKTVYVSKTILSQAVSANIFKYVNFQRLLEVETGFTVNEPVQLALKDAVEKAVENLILEGIEDKLWSSADGQQTDDKLVHDYNIAKQLDEATLLLDREQVERPYKNELAVSAGVNILDGDYREKEPGYSFRFSYARHLSKTFSLELNANPLQFRNAEGYSKQFYSIDLNIRATMLPFDKISPYVYVGTGIVGHNFILEDKERKRPFTKIQYGAGLNYSLSTRMSIFAFAEQNISFTDQLDGLKYGKRDDFYYNFGIGLKYHYN